MSQKTETVQKSDEEWRKELDPVQYQVLRKHATERAGTSPLNFEKRTGEFRCAGCGEPLFDSSTKYESGSGWPSFWPPRTTPSRPRPITATV
jgi:peptide-methionine (R)-S-oxide reductase